MSAAFLLELEQVMDSVIVTANSSPRAMKVNELETIAAEIFGIDRVFSADSLTEAIDKAIKDSIRPLERRHYWNSDNWFCSDSWRSAHYSS